MQNKDLTEEEKKVIHDDGTEEPFSGKYWDYKDDGFYHCKNCGVKLFDSSTKMDSSKGPMGLRGWPAFDNALPDAIEKREDRSLGMVREEIVCKNCGAHLGHLFGDDESKTGQHFCVNSCSLDFEHKKEEK